MLKIRIPVAGVALAAAPLLALLLSACGPAGEPEAAPVSLVETFSAELVAGTFTPEPAAPVAFDPAGGGVLAPGDAFGFAPGAGVDGGAWRGTTASARSVVAFESAAPLASDDRLHAIEIQLRVSAGKALEWTTLGEDGPPTPAFASPDGPPIAFRQELEPGAESRTIRVERARTFSTGPASSRGIRRVLIRPTDVAGAEVAIESVRLVFRRQHLETLAAGIGWRGLSGVFRETLTSRAGEVVRFPLEVPRNAWLDVAVGTPEERAVRFDITVAGGGREPERLLRRTVTTPERWEAERLDLSRWAGQKVELILAASSDKEGALAFWGHPTVRVSGAGPAAPGSDRPQGVILYLADTLRKDHLDAWGYERPTAPVLTRLAGEGARFENAVAQGTWTKISVPSFLSSLYVGSHGVKLFVDRLSARVTTMAEVFRDAGYATLQTSSVPFSGQLTNLQQGVEVLHESSSVDTPDGVSDSKTARLLTDRVLDWVERHRDVPFFAMVHAMDPHSPYEPVAPYRDWWTEPGAAARHEADGEAVRPFITEPLFKLFTMPTRKQLEAAGVDPDAYVEREIGWYDGSIRAMDAELGRLVDRLDHLGLRDRVIVVFLSDHGEELLDHGRHWHGTTVYGEQTDVPLVFWGPGFVPAGVVRQETVQLIDVLPTVAELAGLPVPPEAQGQSLVPLLEGGEGWRPRPAFSERPLGGQLDEMVPGEPDGLFTIHDGGWKLIEIVEDGESVYELYDRASDPLDTRDLAAEQPEVVAELAAKLSRWRQWAAQNRVEGDAAEGLSPEEEERLRSLGYL